MSSSCRERSGRFVGLAVIVTVLLVSLAVAGCGRKGPPRPPLREPDPVAAATEEEATGAESPGSEDESSEAESEDEQEDGGNDDDDGGEASSRSDPDNVRAGGDDGTQP